VPTWVVTTTRACVMAERRLAGAGVEVMRVPEDGQGRVDLSEALRLLALRGITRVFCEGGPALAEALARADLVDEAVLITGPAPLAAPGVPAVGQALAGRLERGLRPFACEAAGADTIEIFVRRD